MSFGIIFLCGLLNYHLHKKWRAKPNAIRCGNGPEYISQQLKDWTIEQQITLLYIQPASQHRIPILNGLIEPLDMSGLIYNYLNPLNKHNHSLQNGFGHTIMNDPINERPHSTIGGMPPRQLLNTA